MTTILDPIIVRPEEDFTQEEKEALIKSSAQMMTSLSEDTLKVLQERIKHNREGKLNWFYKLDLFFRKLMSEKFFLKTGAILLCIGIILNIIF